MEFAVTHEGIAEGQGRWVIALDAERERVLLADEDNTLYWKPLAECTLLKAATPDHPQLVLPVSPQQSPAIAIPNGSGLRRGLRDMN